MDELRRLLNRGGGVHAVQAQRPELWSPHLCESQT